MVKFDAITLLVRAYYAGCKVGFPFPLQGPTEMKPIFKHFLCTIFKWGSVPSNTFLQQDSFLQAPICDVRNVPFIKNHQKPTEGT